MLDCQLSAVSLKTLDIGNFSKQNLDSPACLGLTCNCMAVEVTCQSEYFISYFHSFNALSTLIIDDATTTNQSMRTR